MLIGAVYIFLHWEKLKLKRQAAIAKVFTDVRACETEF